MRASSRYAPKSKRGKAVAATKGFKQALASGRDTVEAVLQQSRLTAAQRQESDARQLQRQQLEDQRYHEIKQIDQQRYEEHKQMMQSTQSLMAQAVNMLSSAAVVSQL